MNCNWDSEGMLRLINRASSSLDVELSEIDAVDILKSFLISKEGISVQDKIAFAFKKGN